MHEILGILKENPVKPKYAFKVWCGVPCAVFLCTTTIQVECKMGCSNGRYLFYNTSATH